MLQCTLVFVAIWGISRSSETETKGRSISCEHAGHLNDPKCMDLVGDRGLLQKKSHKGKANMEMENVAVDNSEVFQPLTQQEFEKYINPGGVNFRDMQQGKLGDCFLLAALVSIAMPRPDIIANMFTDVELLQGKNPVYTVKFMMNGKETKVAVNEMVPARTRRNAAGIQAPWFAAGKRGAKWPLIIEKAYAKAFGDYQRIDGGFGGDVFKAVTNAPVIGYTNSYMSAQELFDIIKSGAENKFIMGAGTAPGCEGIGVACGHAYTVLGAGKFSEQFPQAVKLYNPWGKNGYSGAITGQEQSKGTFWLTAAEFQKHMVSLDVAKVREGYVISPITLSVETQGVTALEFDMTSDKDFSVQLEWPMWRFYKPADAKYNGNCKVDPDYMVYVAKKETPTDYVQLERGNYDAMDISNARADLKGGSGKYVIYVKVNFPYSKSWVKEFVVNVYGPPTKLQQSTTDPADLLASMTSFGDSGDWGSDWGNGGFEYVEKAATIEVDQDADMASEENCARYLDRLPKLNNGREIARLGYDPLFPESLKGLVSRKGLKGGDTATGEAATGFEKYNNWASLRGLGSEAPCPWNPENNLNKWMLGGNCTCPSNERLDLDVDAQGTWRRCT